MKTSAVNEFSTSTMSFRSLTTNDLNDLLPSFYRGLDFDVRRARFGCAVSDDSIIRYCKALDLDRVIVLGCIGATGLTAVIELHRLSPNGEDVELAIADNASADRIMIFGHLLQLAAFVAGKQGCDTIIAQLGPFERDLLWMLRSLGRARVDGDNVRVDIREYACLQSSFLAN